MADDDKETTRLGSTEVSETLPLVKTGERASDKTEDIEKAKKAQKIEEVGREVAAIKDEVARIMDKFNTGPKTRQEIDALKNAMVGCQERLDYITSTNPGLSFPGIEESMQSGIRKIGIYEAVNTVNEPIMGAVFEPEGKDGMMGSEKPYEEKRKKSNERLEQNEQSWDKLSEIAAENGTWTPEKAKELFQSGKDGEEKFHEHLVTATALMSVQAELLKNTRQELQLQEEEILKEARRRGFEAESAIDLAAQLHVVPEEIRLKTPWLKKMEGDLEEFTEHSERFVSQQEQFREDYKSFQALKTTQEELAPDRPVTMDELKTKIPEIIERGGIREEFANEIVADLQKATNIVGEAAINGADVGEAAALMEMCEEIARKCDIDTREFHTPEMFYGELQKRLSENPDLSDDEAIAEIQEVLQEKYGNNESTQIAQEHTTQERAATAPDIELASAPPVTTSQETKKESEIKEPVAKEAGQGSYTPSTNTPSILDQLDPKDLVSVNKIKEENTTKKVTQQVVSTLPTANSKLPPTKSTGVGI